MTIKNHALSEIQKHDAKLITTESVVDNLRNVRMGLVNRDGKALGYIDFQETERDYHVNSVAAFKGLGHAMYCFAMMYLKANHGDVGLMASRFADTTSQARKTWKHLAGLEGVTAREITDPENICVKFITQSELAKERFIDDNIHIHDEVVEDFLMGSLGERRTLMEDYEFFFDELNSVMTTKPTALFNVLTVRGQKLHPEVRSDLIRECGMLFDEFYDFGRESMEYPKYPDSIKEYERVL